MNWLIFEINNVIGAQELSGAYIWAKDKKIMVTLPDESILEIKGRWGLCSNAVTAIRCVEKQKFPADLENFKKGE